MKHLQKFDSHTEFESAQLDPLYVSFDGEHVHYSVSISTEVPDIPTITLPLGADGIENGYGWIDLGLPSGIKWAQCNVGATKACDPGLLFLFSRVDGYSYGDENHQFSSDNPPIASSGKVYAGGEALIREDDAASVNMGGKWRMPTQKEFNELVENTDNSWVLCDVEHEGEHTTIPGRLFVSKTDTTKKLFMPAAGKWDGYGDVFGFNYTGEQGIYWGCEHYENSNDMSWSLDVSEYSCNVTTYSCNEAYSVRGVCYTESLEDGTENSHEYVNLGLPSGTKWAKSNIGAVKPCDQGLFFQWGRVDGCTYDESNPPFSDEYPLPTVSGTKYNDGDVLISEDDAASVIMGGKWHMPTKDDIQELIDNTFNHWTTCDVEHEGEHTTIPGKLFVSKIDQSKKLFIPAAGSYYFGSGSYVNDEFHIWTSSGYDSDNAYELYWSSDNTMFIETASRDTGRSVRGVCK